MAGAQNQPSKDWALADISYISALKNYIGDAKINMEKVYVVKELWTKPTLNCTVISVGRRTVARKLFTNLGSFQCNHGGS